MELQQALEFVLAGRAIMFTGAGFSAGAINLRGTPFKTGRNLAKHLSGLAGLPEDTELDDASRMSVFPLKFGAALRTII